MRRPMIHLVTLAMLLILSLPACSLPASGPPTVVEPDAAYTAAAQTIIAQLTQVSGTQPPTQPLATHLPGTTLSPSAPTAASPTAVSEPTETPTQPEASPTATATPEATNTPAATSTEAASPTDPRASLGDPDFRDSFESGENWSLYEDDHVSFDVDDGELVMTAFNADFWDGWMLSWPVLEDFYLEMTAAPQDCSGLDRYGLVARSIRTDEGYIGYFYGISCDGRYSLRRWDGDKFINIIEWTASEAINAGEGESNRFGLLADGESLSLYANGELLEEVEDDTFDEGRFGVFIGSVNTSDFTVRVEEVAYWELP